LLGELRSSQLEPKMSAIRFLLVALSVSLTTLSLHGQVCDLSSAPSGLTAAYTPGSGTLLQWDAVPGSLGVQLRIEFPTGSSFSRRLLGTELDQFAILDELLLAGTYTWRVQAACSVVPPFALTPVSLPGTFTVDSGSCPPAVSDLDGNIYATVKIGGQCWMQENLKVERYRNGDALTTGLSNAAWQSATTEAFAVYNNAPTNKDKLGLLYNWYAATDLRGLCPVGWHLPTDGEWTDLIDFLGGESVAGGAMKATGTRADGTGVWFAPNLDATNSSNFTALPGGFRDLNGIYGIGGFYAYWWSANETLTNFAYYRQLGYVDGNALRSFDLKRYGFSVRCLKDE